MITREWWNKYRNYYDTICSEMVILELERGSHPYQKEKLALMKDVARLTHLPIIDDIVDAYVEHKLVCFLLRYQFLNDMELPAPCQSK
jgi:hypothetical protein